MATAIKVSQSNFRPGNNAVMSNGRAPFFKVQLLPFIGNILSQTDAAVNMVLRKIFSAALPLLTNRAHYNIIFHYCYMLFGGYL